MSLLYALRRFNSDRLRIMRVLVLVPDMRQHGGVTNIFRELRLDGLQGIGHFTVNTVQPTPVGLAGLGRAWVMVRKVIRLPAVYLRFLNRIMGVELVHSNPSLNTKSFFRDAMFIALALLMRKKVVAFFHGWEDEFEARIAQNPLLRGIFRASYARVPFIIVLGDTFRQRLLALGVNPRCRFLPITSLAGPADRSQFDLEGRLTAQTEVRLLFLSRILEEKGIIRAIDTLVCLTGLLPGRRLVLVVAGDGEDLQSAKLHAERVCPGKVRFVGFLEDDAKRSILADCHLMLFPTAYGEGLPNCILEGMLFGQPIVSRRVGAIPDVVVDGVNGFLTDSLDPARLAELCARILSDQDTFSSMARTNRAVALERYTNEAVKERLLGYYRDILGQDPGFLPRNT